MTTSVLNINNSSNNKNNSAHNNNNNTATNSGGSAAVTASTTTTTTTTAITATASASTSATNRSMQSDEDFNIRFVNLVRAHKCLYDKKVPEYRNRDNQEKAWTLISQDTCESVIHCKERWRNLRACLSRYIKQQSGADPQHKPYYLTEHMSFLLPFLKSTRNSLESTSNGKANLAVLLHLSQQEQQPSSSSSLHALHMQAKYDLHQQIHELQDMKHSLSENEETIDAFDPIITASMQQLEHNRNERCSPPLSDTASANTIQNFIPDVQLAELRTPEPQIASDIFVVNAQNRHQLGNGLRHDESHQDFNNINESISSAPKRIKTECHTDATATGTTSLHCYNSENAADMDFFRSIIPDIAALTPQQKRKLKIGILELIDDVMDRFPGTGERSTNSGNGTFMSGGGGGDSSVGSVSNYRSQQRRNSFREWRK